MFLFNAASEAEYLSGELKNADAVLSIIVDEMNDNVKNDPHFERYVPMLLAYGTLQNALQEKLKTLSDSLYEEAFKGRRKERVSSSL